MSACRSSNRPFVEHEVPTIVAQIAPTPSAALIRTCLSVMSPSPGGSNPWYHRSPAGPGIGIGAGDAHDPADVGACRAGGNGWRASAGRSTASGAGAGVPRGRKRSFHAVL